jgi:hypothetical protein
MPENLPPLRYPLETYYAPRFQAGESILAVYHNPIISHREYACCSVLTPLVIIAWGASLWLASFENDLMIVGAIGIIAFLVPVIIISGMALTHFTATSLENSHARSEETIFTTHHVFATRGIYIAAIPLENISTIACFPLRRNPQIFDEVHFKFKVPVLNLPSQWVTKNTQWKIMRVPRDFPILSFLRERGIKIEEYPLLKKSPTDIVFHWDSWSSTPLNAELKTKGDDDAI